jgi:hypothetical protein
MGWPWGMDNIRKNRRNQSIIHCQSVSLSVNQPDRVLFAFHPSVGIVREGGALGKWLFRWPCQ